MRACLIALAAASACNLALAGTVSAHSTATTLTKGFQPEESNRRFLRSYDMSDLDVKKDSSTEERGIDLTKLDDVINVAKIDKVVDAAKLDDVVNVVKVKAIDAAKFDDVANAAKAKTIDAAKLDDVVNAAKLDDVANAAKAKVVDAAKVDDVIDEAKLDDLLDPEKIKLALKDPDKEAALFAQWHESKELSEAILKRLQGNGNFLKNKDTIFRYNDYRTRFAYNKQLTPWLDTQTLDATLTAFQKHGMKKLTEQFEVWFAAGRTQKQIADALSPHAKLAKKFKVLESHYGHFVEYKLIKIKRADATAAENAAVVTRGIKRGAGTEVEKATDAKRAKTVAEIVEAS